MILPDEKIALFSLLEAGGDLNESQSAELLDYLEGHPDLAGDFDDFVSDLQQLDSSPTPPRVSDVEWGRSFDKILSATPQPAVLGEIPQISPQAGSGFGAGAAGSGSAGIAITVLVAFCMVLLFSQMTPGKEGKDTK